MVVWIGYLQWLNQNGIGWLMEPILRRLDNIQHCDAVLTRDAKEIPGSRNGLKPISSSGIGRFLGDKKMRGELGDEYVDSLRTLHSWPRTGRRRPCHILVRACTRTN